MAVTTEPSRRRFPYPGWIAAGTVALATAVMAVVMVLDRLDPVGGATAEPGTVAPTISDDSGEVGQSTPAGEGAVPAAVNLTDLTMVLGAEALVPLPDELEDDRAYQGALVIGCPSNQTGDRFREVVYETRYGYETLDAQLRAYRDPTDNVLVNLRIYSDPQDREPGAAPPGESHLVQLRMGETRPVGGIAIGDAYHLRLRVECEKPDGYMIIVGAVVHPAT